ncbi:MAG: hypothetical protein M9894_25815 [Planctomycetes bacterium]|nr:hypothetical protein [Planctomycetota bacterium]
MTPSQPKTQLSLGDRTTGSTPAEINYGFLHRGSVILATPTGLAVRLELYQKRDLARLSLDN